MLDIIRRSSKKEIKEMKKAEDARTSAIEELRKLAEQNKQSGEPNVSDNTK